MFLMVIVETKEINWGHEGRRSLEAWDEKLKEADNLLTLQRLSQGSESLVDVWKPNDLEDPHHVMDDELDVVVGGIIYQSLEHHLSGCHFALVTDDSQRPFVSQVIRYSHMESRPLAVIDIEELQNTEPDEILTALWGGATTVCRALLVDLTSVDDSGVFRFLDLYKVSIWPDAWIVLVGSLSKARTTLYHKVFRNTLRPVYLGLHHLLLGDLNTKRNMDKLLPGQSHLATQWNKDKYVVSVYSRCLYCSNGDPQMQFLFLWHLGLMLPQHLNPLPDQYDDMQGHMFRVVSMPSFPYNDLRLDSDEPATTVTLRDCLDKRMLHTISARLNFTYETRAPWDLEWGRSTGTVNWTGLVGTIQYNKADFITTIAPTPGRNVIIDTTRAYTPDVLALVSLKPQLLPQYLVIIRPFTVDVWLYLLLSIMVWGIALWLLQRTWSQYSGKHGMTLSKALFYSWAVILEDPPLKPPKNITAQLLIGVWLVASLVISTGFRAALVSHLAVQSKTKPVDNFKELMSRGDYKWGMEASSLTGVPLIYFKTTSDPVVKYIYKYLENVPTYDIAFSRTIQGKYAIVCWRKLCQNLIDSYYTDNIGNTPYYVSKEGYSIVPYFGWGYGKGAPFRDRFNMLQNRINEAGIIQIWTDDIMASRVRENRGEIEKENQERKMNFQLQQLVDEKTIRLRLVHLVGVFFVLFSGFGVSGIIFLVERIVYTFTKTN